MENNAFILKVTHAEYIRDYILRLTFNNGEVRMCDFLPLAQKGICTKLQDKEYFKAFRLDPFTVDWNNEIGFAPEFLYEKSQEPGYTLPESGEPGMVAETEPSPEEIK